MSAVNLRRSVVSAQILTRLAIERGLTLDACLHNTGIHPGALSDPAAEITGDQELQLIRNMLGGLGPVPGLGLDAGLRYHISAYGIWGFAILSSPTYRSAIEVGVRYLALGSAFVRYRLENVGDGLRIILDDSDVPEDLRQFIVERDFAAWATAARELRPGGFPARSAQFRMAPPTEPWRLERLCGVKPVFNAPTNALIVDAATIDIPMPQANPVMALVCEEQCRQLLARRQARSGLAGEIRDRLLREPGDLPSLDTVAEELHMATRSLRRRLDEEGTSFRALVNEVRQTLAEELLTSTDMKLSEIADRLGYTEPAAFITAFRRWKNESPTAFRTTQRERRSD